MALTDTHCHLDLEQFDSDRGAVIQRAKNAGLSRILVPSLTVTSSRVVVKLAESHPMLYAAVGVHPNEAESWDGQTIPALKELAAGSLKVVAIGEVGLDYYWNKSPHEEQISILREQLSLAAELELPVVIHSREKEDADHGECAEDLIKILEEWVSGLRPTNDALAQPPGVLHSFSGSIETAKRALALGFYIGVTGPVTYKNAERKRQVIASLPLERLLIETDAPYLTPEPQRGKRNEPAFVSHIADKIAEIKSRTPQEVAGATTENAARLLSWGESV
ncbi:MAG TPA: TatD family hydrolase [Anaerolineales bacterium]|nr:TatD family hydrolase [Anaerolineales bacterium]